jgi:hypothetical protein
MRVRMCMLYAHARAYVYACVVGSMFFHKLLTFALLRYSKPLCHISILISLLYIG